MSKKLHIVKVPQRRNLWGGVDKAFYELGRGDILQLDGFPWHNSILEMCASGFNKHATIKQDGREVVLEPGEAYAVKSITIELE